jgi:4-hydroxy-tetrahydrodipicolinate synthase
MLTAPGWAIHNHASNNEAVYELTIQDSPAHIALDSLMWQEDLKLPPRLLGKPTRIPDRSVRRRMTVLGPAELVGSFTPVVTPFDDGVVDLEAFQTLVDRQAIHGSQGVVITGTSGEPSVLTSVERLNLVRAAVEAADKRLSVVAAIGTESLTGTLELSAGAVAAGALLVVTPYYIRPPQRGLVEYFARVALRVEVPVLIYHIPGRAAVSMDPSTVETIVDRAPNVVAMKHASAELSLVTDLLERLGHEFRIFVGLEELSLPMLAVGARGLMNAVGNLVPERVVALWQAIESNDLAAPAASTSNCGS